MELAFESLEAARDRLLSLGSGVEVLAPPALRASLADYARQIVAIYSEYRPRPASKNSSYLSLIVTCGLAHLPPATCTLQPSY